MSLYTLPGVYCRICGKESLDGSGWGPTEFVRCMSCGARNYPPLLDAIPVEPKEAFL